MLYFILFLIRYFPFWALPVGIVFVELGIHYYRQRARIQTAFFFGTVGCLAILTVLWFLTGGQTRWGSYVRTLLT